MDQQFFEASLQSLHVTFPGCAFLDTAALATAISSTPNSIYARISRGELPIPACKDGAKTLFPITEVARYLAGAYGRRPLNRPTKK